MIYIVFAILILGFLIFAHELGHFLAAKKSGVIVEEFGFGYPPRIFGKKIKGTIYSINIIPFGGFVKIKGEDRASSAQDLSGSFSIQKPLTKTKILLAGVLANGLVAILIFYFLLGAKDFSFYMPSLYGHRFAMGEQKNYLVITSVLDNSAAKSAGLQEYDLIISANDSYFSSFEEFIEFLNNQRGRKIIIKTENLNSKLIKEVEVNLPSTMGQKGILGAMLQSMAKVEYKSFGQKIFSGFLHSANIIDYSFKVSKSLVKESIREREVKPLANLAVGPIGILAISKDIIKGGLWQIFNLIAILSLGLGLVNILPIPAADGGRMVFVLYEAIFKKPAPVKFEKNFNLAGYIFLITLSLAIAFKDIFQFKDIFFR